MSVQSLLDDGLQIIDVDSHVAEPTDLWTSRLPKRFADQAPVVEWHEARGRWRWRVGDRFLSDVGFFTGGDAWGDYPPNSPPTLDDAHPGTYDPHARLRRLDELGVSAQVLYPNLIGFNTYAFMITGLDLALACVRAYNDFLVEFAAADPTRLIPIAMLPFWDLDESVRELERARSMGHKGFLFANQFEKLGLPRMVDQHWDPILAAAQDLELSANFHVGFSSNNTQDKLTQEELDDHWYGMLGNRTGFVRTSSLAFLSNVNCVIDLIIDGVCERYPRLPMVCVESGFGYVPFLLEMLDWQWQNAGAARENPSRLLPSEYFRRQIYASFWFETSSLGMLEQYEDNVMFETDYPHNTSLTPGPLSLAVSPRDHVVQHFTALPDRVVRKVVHDNAARLYHLT